MRPAGASERFPQGTFEVLCEPGRSPALSSTSLPQRAPRRPARSFSTATSTSRPEGKWWTNGREAFKPVIEGDRLYGRGAGDDGYNFYAAMTALMALDQTGTPRPRAVGPLRNG